MAAGQHVLVQGGAGGVGIHVVQIAAGLGARVSATAAAADLEFVKGLGAEQAIDYAHDRFEDNVRDVDVVIDLVGGPTQLRPVLDRVLPLTETRSGYEALETGDRRGKIVIDIAD